MPEPCAEERIYYIVQATVAVVVGAVSVWAYWRMTTTEADRAALVARFTYPLTRWRSLRRLRAEQTDLTWETWLILEELEGYDGTRDLRTVLDLAA